MIPPEERIWPDPRIVRLMVLGRIKNPGHYADSIARLDQPLNEHPPNCSCPADVAARLTAAVLPPLTTTEETTVALLHKKIPADATACCRLCGLAVAAPTRPKADSFRDPGWPTCDECGRLLAENRHVSQFAPSVAVLADMLDLALDPTDPGVIRFVTMRMPAAQRDPRFVNESNGVGSEFLARDRTWTPWRPGSGVAERWEWVDRKQVQAALDRSIGRSRNPRPHPEGLPCGACGTSKAMSWRRKTVQLDSPRARDRWPLCSPCAQVWSRAGSTVHSPSWRTHLSAYALGGFPALPGVIPEVRAYAETVTSRDGAVGVAEPFGYIDAEAMTEARRLVWKRRPKLAPPQEQDRMTRLRRAEAIIDAARPRQPVSPISLPTPADTPDVTPLQWLK